MKILFWNRIIRARYNKKKREAKIQLPTHTVKGFVGAVKQWNLSSLTDITFVFTHTTLRDVGDVNINDLETVKNTKQ